MEWGTTLMMFVKYVCTYNSKFYFYNLFIVLDPASQILLDNEDKLDHLSLSGELVSSLCDEKLTTEEEAREMLVSDQNVLAGKSLRRVCCAVADDHDKLKVLADVLMSFDETRSLGEKLLECYRKYI